MRRRQDSGYALLLVLLISATIAIMLYKELPRVAFDTQRQKEQLLIERGEQYKRAIQLFLRANNNARWPASIDELESFNNKRFLRHRYKDPMTGKDEWRLIHIANGILTDSVNNKAKKPDEKDKGNGSSSNITAYAGLGQEIITGTASLNPATRRRVSEGGSQLGPDGQPIGGAPGSGGLAGGALTGAPPGLPGANTPSLAGATAQGAPPPLGFPVPGQPFPGMSIPGQAGINTGTLPAGSQPNGTFTGSPATGSPATGSQPTSGGSSVGNYGSFGSTAAQPTVPQPNAPVTQGGYPGMGGYPGAGGYPGMPGPPANSQNMGGVPAYPTAPGANGMPPSYPNPGMSINPQQNNAAAALIGSLLTSPRPGGMPTAGTAGGNGIMGGGIAGVATKAEGESIMTYADHTKLNEWEFIWDPTKYRPPPNPLQGSIGTAASQLGSMPGTQVGTPASQIGSMPGSPAGTSGTSGSQTNGPGGTSTNSGQQTPAAAGFGGGGAPPNIRPGRP